MSARLPLVERVIFEGRDAETKVKIVCKYLLFYPVLIEALNHPSQVPCRCCDNSDD